jgi:hypothetical protein
MKIEGNLVLCKDDGEPLGHVISAIQMRICDPVDAKAALDEAWLNREERHADHCGELVELHAAEKGILNARISELTSEVTRMSLLLESMGGDEVLQTRQKAAKRAQLQSEMDALDSPMVKQ